MTNGDKWIKKHRIYYAGYMSHIYLDRASQPMSSAFEETLPHRVLTAVLSLALRLILPVDRSRNARITPDRGFYT